MSVESLAIVLHHSRAKGAAKVIMLGIANHDGDGGAWPSLTTLAKYANVNRDQARKLVADLERRGEVRRIVNGGGKLDTPDYLRPNLYQMLVRCPPDCDRSPQHRTPKDREAVTFIPGLEPLDETPPPQSPPVKEEGGPRSPTTGGGGHTDPPNRPTNQPSRDPEKKPAYRVCAHARPRGGPHVYISSPRYCERCGYDQETHGLSS